MVYGSHLKLFFSMYYLFHDVVDYLRSVDHQNQQQVVD